MAEREKQYKGTFTFNKLFELMAKKNIKKVDLRVKYHFSPTLINRLNHDQTVSIDTIIYLCEILDCQPSDIIEYIPPKKPEYVQVISSKKLEGVQMGFKYKINILKELKNKGYSSYRLINNHIFNVATLQKFRNGKMVSFKSFDKLCEILDCDIGDIITFTKIEESKTE